MTIDPQILSKLRNQYAHGDYAQLAEFSKKEGSKGRGWNTFKNAIDSGKCSPKTLEIMLNFYKLRNETIDEYANHL